MTRPTPGPHSRNLCPSGPLPVNAASGPPLPSEQMGSQEAGHLAHFSDRNLDVLVGVDSEALVFGAGAIEELEGSAAYGPQSAPNLPST